MAIFKSSAKLLLLLLLPFISAHATHHRFLHGLFSEYPTAFPPSAYQFFNPHSPPPGAGQLAVSTPRGSEREFGEMSAPPMGVGVEGKMVIVLGFVVVVVVVVGVLYVSARRPAKARVMLLPVGGLGHEKEGGAKAAS